MRDNSDHHSAFADYGRDGIAVITIYRKPTRHTLDMANPVSCYETLGRGATASARREIRELESPR